MFLSMKRFFTLFDFFFILVPADILKYGFSKELDVDGPAMNLNVGAGTQSVENPDRTKINSPHDKIETSM